MLHALQLAVTRSTPPFYYISRNHIEKEIALADRGLVTDLCTSNNDKNGQLSYVTI